MARTDFGPEVKASMEPNANTPEREPPAIARQERQMQKDSNESGARPPRIGPGRGAMAQGAPAQRAPTPPIAPVPTDAHHIAAAASIAHAILGNRGIQ